MNTTSDTELMQVDDELLPAEPQKRASPGTHDEAYVKAFVENPHLGKANAYREATGDNTSYSRQRAYVMHSRLEARINEALKQRVLGAIGFGMNKLFDLAENADSEQVQALCASKLIDMGMKVSPPEVKASQSRTREEILESIENTRERIKLAQRGVIS